MSRYNRDENADMLFRAVLSLETVDQCYDFFEDLCTKVELREMSRRFEAARLIREGEKYTTIVEKTGLSTATISRVNGALRDGNGGYSRALDELGVERK
jgi:TrpR-related protein YerC/YecD